MKKVLILLLVILGLLVLALIFGYWRYQALQSKANEVSSYNVTVLQTGGVGSQTTTIQAYVSDSQQYLSPASDYGLIFFNRPGDIMNAGCKDGYHVENASSPTGNVVSQPSQDFNEASIEIRNQLQNTITYTCLKQ